MIVGEKKYLDIFYTANTDSVLDQLLKDPEDELTSGLTEHSDGLVRSVQRNGVTVHLVCVEDIVTIDFGVVEDFEDEEE